jgi:Zn-dependent peptidase ImmA (M78 family)/transcriptional regulator with XRE-family HTH domain
MPKKSFEVTITPEVLKWLRQSSGWTEQDTSERLKISEETYLELEEGKRKPKITQLEVLAKAFRRPVVSFLLSTPQVEASSPQDFRAPTGKEKTFSKKMLLAFRRARNLQNSSRELMKNLGITSKPQINIVSASQNSLELAKKERLASGINLDKQMEWADEREAFKKWRNFIEGKNIQVFQIRMPTEEASGFSLTDKQPFVIVINSSDDTKRKIFTLFHEYAHILLSETGVCLPEFETNIKNERWCERFAAEFILPEETRAALQAQMKKYPELGKLLERCSILLKVSKYALLVRLKEFELINAEDYKKWAEYLKKAVKKPRKKTKGGPNQLVRCRQEKGGKYISLVLDNLDRGLINTYEALDRLSIKLKYLDEVQGKGAVNAQK